MGRAASCSCRSSSCAAARPGSSPRWASASGSRPGTIMSRGTAAQKERWALDLLTFDKVGAWAITEPDSGSDAFGRMQSTRAARRRRVRPQRAEDLHHERPVRRHDDLHLQARRGEPAAGAQDPLVRARQGDARVRADEADAQDGHALVADRDALPRRRARGQGPPARRDRGRAVPRRREAGVLDRADRRRRDVARDHRALPRAVHRVRQGDGPVRQADRRPPAHPGEARPDGGAPAQHREPGVPGAREGRGGGRRWTSPRPRR